MSHDWNKKWTVLYVCTDWDIVEGSGASLIDMIQSARGNIEPIVLVRHEGAVSRRLAQQGIQTIVVPFFYIWEKLPSLKTFLRYLFLNERCARKIKKKLGGKHVDIVHTNTTVTTVGVVLSRILGAKHVWHLREDLQRINIAPYMGMKRLKRAISRADARIAVSAAIHEAWPQYSDNTFVLPDCVFQSAPTQTPLNATRQHYFLFLSIHINYIKGADLAVESFCQAQIDDDYKLLMVGNCTTEYKQHLLSIASQYNKANRIDFLSPTDSVESLFRNASGLLQCSANESLGRVSIEAMAYGCPLIARLGMGNSQIVEDGRTGFLFDTANQCARIIESVAKHYPSNVCDNAYHQVCQQYVADVFSPKLLNIYNQVM
ncbi:MAG: glycosyltransferase family 4 protein [Bacteroidales bacterium]|nr:glycosyltransferase family 4 protein [Bacteroidales bacterium]MBR1799437.1 glycosyltransferase family 4 protein [Bacteroidales bacterium]